jgi:hypothetical protein
LGDLLSREAVEAMAGAGLRVRALQARIEPLVTALSELAAESSHRHLAGAIQGLVEKRRRNQLLMQEALVRIRGEIDSRTRALERLRRVRPVYGKQNAVATRLNVAT